MMVAITVDMEWGPEQTLVDLFSIFDQYSVPVTVFSTHDDGLSLIDHERALHPNFMRDVPNEKALEEIATIYPSAIGSRSHGLHAWTNLRDLYDRHGIKYESNYMQYDVQNLEPFWMPDGTVQFPIYWMDYIWLKFRDRKSSDVAQNEGLFDIEDFFAGPGLKVLDFHPTHTYYNTPTISYYEQHKDAYYDGDESACFEGFGIRDVLFEVLEYISEHNVEIVTLGELYERFQQSQPYENLYP
jgi:hypothetical protein